MGSSVVSLALRKRAQPVGGRLKLQLIPGAQPPTADGHSSDVPSGGERPAVSGPWAAVEGVHLPS